MAFGLSQGIIETLNNPPSIYQQCPYSPIPVYYIEPSTNKPFLISVEKSRNKESIYGITKCDINANQCSNFAEITDTVIAGDAFACKGIRNKPGTLIIGAPTKVHYV